jgi:predicted RNA-binding Zn ribbon-like protein
MTIWTKHRFSGGALALDLANTVVWKDEVTRTMDRLLDYRDSHEFSAAARLLSGDVASSSHLLPPRDSGEHAKLITLRNAIDDWLRPMALGQDACKSVAPLFKACWTATENSKSIDLVHACALSAMQFFQPETQKRVKLCPACRWLFLDRSKNQSRRWCDMKVCGNRAKAQQHYHANKYKGECTS